jgi:predicted permease
MQDSWWVQVFGRLRPGVSESAAAKGLTSILAHSIDGYAGNSAGVVKPPVYLLPGDHGVGLGRAQRATALWVLGGTVGLVLLIACVNLANLLLARAESRQREIAIRLSIGATRGRLVRQLFTESLLLSGLGGIGGLLVSGPLAGFLISHQGGGEPLAFDVRNDVRTLAFTFGVALLAGLAFGLAPAWRATRFGAGGGFKPAGGAVTHSRGRLRFHWLLISAQVAFSMILLVAAGLFLRTLAGLSSIDLGFQPQNILTFRTDASRDGYKNLALATLYDRLRQRLAAIPEVESVVLSEEGLINNSESDGVIYFPGRAGTAAKGHTMIFSCSDSFLTAMRIPILWGRDLAPSDGPNATHAVVINESFRKRYFADEDPIGKTLYWGSPPFPPNEKPFQIVGVARDAHYYSVRVRPEPTMYANYLQLYQGIRGVTFALRSHLPPASLAASVRRAAADVSAALPIADLRTQEEQIRRTLGTERLFAGLLSMFGLLATLLAAIGLYGVLSYSVSRRTAEIGIRMALGATRANVLWQMMQGCLLAVAAGLCAGVPAALSLTRVARSLLYGITPQDIRPFVEAALLLLAVSVISAWIPARRGAAIQPTQALRYE